MITRANALKLSAWLASQHPDLFRSLARQVTLLQRSPYGRLGYFGDDAGLTDFSGDVVTVTADAAPSADFSSVDTSAFSPDVSLSDINFDPGSIDVSVGATDALTQAIAGPATPDSSVADSSAASPSFWSSLGSGVSSLAGSIGKVASSLVSPQALSSVAAAAGAFFTAQAKTSAAQAQAQTQQAILQSQLARVGAGAAPAPISYARNPLTGALMPVYNTNTGPVPVTQPLLNRLSSPQTAGISPTLLIGGGIAVLTLLSLAAAKRS